jgi:hypothetical protein
LRYFESKAVQDRNRRAADEAEFWRKAMNATYKTTAKEVEQGVTEAVDHLADKMHDGGRAAGKVAEDAAKRTKRTLSDAGEVASGMVASVKDAAVEKADAARETLSDVGERLAATLQRASTDDAGDASKSKVLGSVAQGLTTASDALRQRSVADLTSDVKMLARRHPGVFMAAAAVAGFAAARFIRSSSQRRMAEREGGKGPGV